MTPSSTPGQGLLTLPKPSWALEAHDKSFIWGVVQCLLNTQLLPTYLAPGT